MSLPRRFCAATALVGLTLAGACSDDDTPTGVIQPGAADITQDITASRTLYKDTTSTLKGFIHVANGATHTIQAGTTIKGDYNTVGSSLFVQRGAKIIVQCTESAPIVVTSSQPVGSRKPGDWGGLILVVNAIGSRGVVQVEGTGTSTGSTSGTNYAVNYGEGSTQSDNSGILQ